MFLFIAAVLIVIIYLYSREEENKKIFGVYSVPGKWYPVKYVAFLVMYFYKKFRTEEKNIDTKALYPQVSSDTGININNRNELEKAQQLSDHPMAFDAIFFIATNNDGYYIVSGCERRKMGTAHCPFYIGVPGKGLLCAPKTPDTLLFGAEPNTFGAEGLLMKPEEPMKKWTISYKGKMCYQSEPLKSIDVQFDAEWIGKWKYFNYDTDLHPLALARAIAREPWSREYFEDLKRVHQSHYEQFGMMYATFTIDGEQHKIKLQAFRDHSFGHMRDWELMHRYAFHHIFLENGTCASVGVVCYPSTSTSMEMGVVCYPNGKVEPLKWCDLQLYQHGENGDAPRDYAFSFKAGHTVFTVQVLVEMESVHYVGKNWDARMVERFTKYIVNGVPGRGVSEFHYNHKNGRPEEYSKNDPIWYQKLHSRL